MSRIWQVTSGEQPAFPPLDKDITVDVAIVGAGITGLTTALQLLKDGLSVAVLESHSVGGGDTGGSTGNLYATASLGLAQVRQKWGDKVTAEFVRARNEGLNFIEQTVGQLAIPCEFQRLPLYRCALRSDRSLERQLEEEYQASRSAGLGAELTSDVPMGIKAAKALRLDAQAQFNPLAYTRALANAVKQQGGMIHEMSSVKEISGRKGVLKTDTCTITARDIVLATHTPIGFNLLQTEMLSYLEHGISAKLKGGSYPEGTFWILDGFYSLRSYHHNGQDHLIAVGAKHQVGHTEYNGQYYQHLKDFVSSRFEVEQFEHSWSAQQFRSADLLPYIGRAPAPGRVYVGTGYAADGLVWGAVAARMIADQIQERDNPWTSLFNPQRFTPIKSAGNLMKLNAHVMKHYVTNYLKPAPCKSIKEVKRGEGRIVAVKGTNLAVYRDFDDRVSAVSSVCTHMKCKVSWNAADLTWDCACHGSRFDIHGQVVEGPAVRPLEKHSVTLHEEERVPE